MLPVVVVVVDVITMIGGRTVHALEACGGSGHGGRDRA